MQASRGLTWLKRFGLLLVFLFFTTTGVLAQSPSAATPGLRSILTPGMRVWITDGSGREEKTQIVDVSGEVVITTTNADTRRFQTADILRVSARQSDSVLNGALIGAGVAVASGLFLCSLTEPWENCRDDVGPMFRTGAVGAGIGIGIDALIRGRKTIYEAASSSTRLDAAPVLGRGTAGLRVSLRF